jgi:hypothetical protein
VLQLEESLTDGRNEIEHTKNVISQNQLDIKFKNCVIYFQKQKLKNCDDLTSSIKRKQQEQGQHIVIHGKEIFKVT